MSQDETGGADRWQRRERRRRDERERIKKHGATLRRVYENAVRKRLLKARKAK